MAAEPLGAKPIRKGESAPWDGQILSTKRAVELAVRFESYQEKCHLKIENLKALHEIEIKSQIDRHAIALNASEQRADIIMSQLEEASVFYRSPLFVSGASVVGTIVGIIVAIIALDHAAATRP